MADDLQSRAELEIAHVLFIDVVGYSTRLINEQAGVVAELNQVVKETTHFVAAESAGKLIRIPTGDGMALVFFNTPEAPVQCALEICKPCETTRTFMCVNGNSQRASRSCAGRQRPA